MYTYYGKYIIMISDHKNEGYKKNGHLLTTCYVYVCTNSLF